MGKVVCVTFYHFVTKRSMVHSKEISWTQVETGPAMEYSVILRGDSSIGEYQ